MNPKVDLLTAKYGAALEKHYDALDSGFKRSLQGQYGANDWFRDVAKASERAGLLWQESWKVVFPTLRTLPIVVKEGTASVSEVFSIVDHRPKTFSSPVTLDTGADTIEVTARLVGQDGELLLVEITDPNQHLDQKPPTGSTPYSKTVMSTGANSIELFVLELHIK